MRDALVLEADFVEKVLATLARTIAPSESLQLGVIAEGVETEAQRAWLMVHGCHAFQGCLFGRPVPLEALGLGD